jgi:large subunit ribosomal protein L24
MTKLKKGDNIIIITGKDKNKKGKIIRVLPKKDKVVVEGLNMLKKHKAPRRSGEQGSILDIAMPIHISNVKKVD